MEALDAPGELMLVDRSISAPPSGLVSSFPKGHSPALRFWGTQPPHMSLTNAATPPDTRTPHQPPPHTPPNHTPPRHSPLLT